MTSAFQSEHPSRVASIVNYAQTIDVPSCSVVRGRICTLLRDLRAAHDQGTSTMLFDMTETILVTDDKLVRSLLSSPCTSSAEMPAQTGTGNPDIKG